MRARQPWRASRSGVAALLACGLLALSAPAAAEPVDEAGGQLFASVATARRERYLHEVFEFTVSVFSRGLTMGREIALVNEETPGLQFGPFRDAGSGREEVNGRTYDVRRFVGRAEAVAAGAYALRPTVRLTVVVPARGDGSPGRAEIRRTDLHPLASSLRVSALPEAGRPAAFSGAVGTFGFTASVRPAAVPAGEPVTLTMEIRGSGNIGPVAAPRVDGGAGFKAFEPRLLAKETGADGLSGRLAFEQTVVPLTAASTSLPAVRFAYFDPEQGGYREIVRGPFALALRPSVRPAGALPPEAPAAARPAPQPSRAPAAIAPLKPEPGAWLAIPVRSWHASAAFLLAQCVPLALLLAIFFMARRREELARDVGKARRLVAPDAARAGLDAARLALEAGDAARFHDALWEALSGYFGNRLNLRRGEISAAAVTAGLAAAGIDPAEVARLGEIFALLEAERFGRPPRPAAPLPADRRQRLAGLLEEVDRLMRACEAPTP